MNVYLDNSATTAVCPEAAGAALQVMTVCYGNPSSTHAMGREARKILDSARGSLAAALGCSPAEVYFTSGGTEADDTAVFGGCEKMRHQGKHIITTAVEHDAVIKSFERMGDLGWDVTFIQPEKDGKISPEKFSQAIREDTVLASVMTVNNETGAVNDIKKLRGILRETAPQALFHTDAVQAFCHMDVSPKNTGVDMISVSAHKIHGPKGVGALYVRKGLNIKPLLYGGGQESGMRSGTENLPGIAAFGKAAQMAWEAMDDSRELFSKLRADLLDRLKASGAEFTVIGGGADHILSVSFPGYRSEVLLNYLDSRGVYISKGSACKRGARSHVLSAMKLDGRVIDGAVRISFSRYNTLEDTEYTASVISEALGKLIKTK